MKKTMAQGVLLALLFLWLLPNSIWAVNVAKSTLLGTGLPLLVVETVDGEEPTCEYLTIEDGYPGNSIRNATKVPGRVLLLQRQDTLFDSGDYQEDAGGMTIKMRGNSSAFRWKHPFKIKLVKKADMLCRNDVDKYKDRDWLLLDGSNMNMMTGMAVSRLVGLQWTPGFRYVNLLFNGQYRGIYILCESVKRNPSCRIDVDKEEGFIIEKDAYWWNEDVYFQSLASERKYTFKYPDPDDITDEQVGYAQERISQWEASLADGGYDEHIDVASFASWLLAHDILGNADAAGSNIFLTCHDHGSKIQMGNLWDLDTNFYREDEWSAIHEWWDFPFLAMLESSNTSFAEAFLAKWEEVEPWLFEQLDAELSDFLLSDECDALEQSRRMENDSIGFRFPTIADDIDHARQWFDRRAAWLQSAMCNLTTTISTNHLPVVVATQRNNARPTYRLNGTRLPPHCLRSAAPLGSPKDSTPTRSGLYIKDGRKVVVR